VVVTRVFVAARRVARQDTTSAHARKMQQKQGINSSYCTSLLLSRVLRYLSAKVGWL
jgi:Flp pilus assembly protein TadG